MGMEVTTLSVQVKSDGIDQATKSLDNLGSQAERTEKAVDKLTSKLANTSSSFGAIKASLNELKTTMALSFPTDGAQALNKAMMELSSTLATIKGKNFKVDIIGPEFTKNTETAVKGVKSLNQAFMEGNNVFQLVGKSLYDIRNLLGGTMLAGALVGTTSEVIKLADSWSLMKAKLNVALGSMDSAVNMQEKLFKVATSLHVPLEGVTQLFVRLVPAMKEYGYTTTDALQVTTAMASALKVSGATAAEASSVMLQFSQSMQAGRLNGAEFNAVAEGAPIVLRAIAAETGKTRAELKQMGADGQLGIELITKAMVKWGPVWEKLVKDMPVTFEAAMGDLSTSMARFMGITNESLGVTQTLSAGIEWLAKNLETIAKIIGVGVVAAIAALTTSLVISAATAAADAVAMVSLAAAIGGTGVASAGAAVAVEVLTGALATLNINPIVLAVTALVAAGAAVYAFATKTEKPLRAVYDNIDRINEAHPDSKGKFEAFTKEVEKLDKQITDGYKNYATLKEKQEKAFDTTEANKLTEQLKIQAKAIGDLEAAQKLYAQQIQNTGKVASDAHTKFMKEHEAQMQILGIETNLKRKLSGTEETLVAKVRELQEARKLDPSSKRVQELNTETIALGKQISEEMKHDAVLQSVKQSKKEAESFDSKYDKETSKLSLFISKQEEELGLGRKVTEAEKEALKVNQFMLDYQDQLSAARTKELTQLRDKILALGKLQEYQASISKQLEDNANRQYEKNLADIQGNANTDKAIKDAERQLTVLSDANKGYQDTAVAAEMYKMSVDAAGNAVLELINKEKQAEIRRTLASNNLSDDAKNDRVNQIQKEIEANDRLIDQYYKLLPIKKKILEETAKAATIKMLETGRTPGQILADGFGEAGAAIAKMSDAYKTFGDDMAKVDKYVADQKKMLMDQGEGTPENLAKVDKEVADKRIQINAQMYGSLAGAAKGFFSENSKGYQAMAKAEKAFRVIELAMAAKTALTKMALMGETLATYLFGVSAATAATEASVPKVLAAEGAKAQAAGATAVTEAAHMPGPMAFVGAAAMIALLAGIGVMLGGGGSTPNLSAQRQATQGTGSVFGDSSAKSESTTKALEMVAKNSEIALTYNAGMLASLKNIEASLVGVAKLVIRSGVQSQVGFAAGMGTTTDSSMNKAFGIGNQLGSMNMATLGIGSLINSVGKALFSVKKSVVDSGFLQAAQSLSEIMTSGLAVKGYTDIETKTKKAGRTKTKVDTNLSELSTDLQEQLTKVVTNLGDSLSNAAKALGMDGESFTNTLESFVVDIGRISIQGMDAKQIQETLTNVFSKLGDDMATAVLPGLTKFQNIGEGYFETLTRVATTVATVDGIFGQFGQTFSLTGIEAIDAKMKLVDLAGGLQELASKVTSFYDHFSTEAEKQANQTKIVTDQFAKLGLTMIDLKADDARIKFRELVESLKDTNLEAYNSMLNLEGIVNDLTPAFAKVATAAEIAEQKISMQDKINQLTMTSSKYLAASRKKELEKMDESLRPLQQRINALEDEKQALALQDKINQLTMSKQDYLILTRQKELAAMDESLRPLQQRIYAIEDEKTALETLKTSANKAMSVLEKSVTAEKTALKKSLDDKLANIDYAKEYENAVYEVAKANIESKASADETYYSNQQKALETQVTASKEYYDNIKSLFDNISSTIDKLTSSSATLQSQTYKTAKAQLDSSAALAKVGILPNTEAFKSVTEGLTSLSSSGFSSLIDFQREQLVNAGKLQSIKDVAGPQMSNAEAAVKYAEQSVASIKILSDDASQFYKDQLKELDDNHKGNIQRLDDQIKILNLQYQDDIEYLDSILSVAKSQLELAEGTYIETKGVKDAVNNFSGALISYISAKDAQTAEWVNQISSMALSTVPTLTDIAERTSAENQQLKDEIAGMREDAAAQSRAIAANTAAAAKVLKQWDGDGQPEVRNVA